MGERKPLPARLVEVRRREPALEIGLAQGPFRIEHGEPRRIPIAALDDHVLAKDSLEAEAEAQGGTARGLVQRITLPLVAAVAQIMEGVAPGLRCNAGAKIILPTSIVR